MRRQVLYCLIAMGQTARRRLCSASLSSLGAASLLERFEIGHDVLDLAGLKLEPRHFRMNPLR